jgi:hypothetical protein
MKGVASAATSFLFAFLVHGQAKAVTIATQDLFLIDSIGVTSTGAAVQLIDIVLAQAQSASTGSFLFPGGGIFTQTSAFGGLASDPNAVILGNTSVIPGVFSFNGSSALAVLVSSDVSSGGSTLGTSGLLELNLTSAFPADVNVGDTGVVNYSLLQLTRPADNSGEIGLSPLSIAISRANNGSGVIPSIDGINPLYGEELPFIVADGSKGWRIFGKFLIVCGATVTGAGAGACAGAQLGAGAGAVTGGVVGAGVGAAPGAAVGGGSGAVIGAVVGGAGALLSSTGAVIVSNNEDNPADSKTRALPDPSGVPTSKKAVDVPAPLPLFGVGFAFSYSRRLRRMSKSLNRVDGKSLQKTA